MNFLKAWVEESVARLGYRLCSHYSILCNCGVEIISPLLKFLLGLPPENNVEVIDVGVDKRITRKDDTTLGTIGVLHRNQLANVSPLLGPI